MFYNIYFISFIIIIINIFITIILKCYEILRSGLIRKPVVLELCLINVFYLFMYFFFNLFYSLRSYDR